MQAYVSQGLIFVDKCAMITSCTYINFIRKFIVRQKLSRFFLSNAHCRLLGIYTILCKNFYRHVQHTKIIVIMKYLSNMVCLVTCVIILDNHGLILDLLNGTMCRVQKNGLNNAYSPLGGTGTTQAATLY